LEDLTSPLKRCLQNLKEALTEQKVVGKGLFRTGLAPSEKQLLIAVLARAL
jgi:hypothetical protein